MKRRQVSSCGKPQLIFVCNKGTSHLSTGRGKKVMRASAGNSETGGTTCVIRVVARDTIEVMSLNGYQIRQVGQ